MGGGTGEHRWWAKVREMKESSKGRLHPTLVASGPESDTGATSHKATLEDGCPVSGRVQTLFM